jgi:hypothetical protein
MGRTLPSITQAFLQEQESFSRFRRALRRSDQHALDDLFAAARQHLAAAAYAAHPLPFETFLLAMLLEEHKRTLRLQSLLEDLLSERQNEDGGALLSDSALPDDNTLPDSSTLPDGSTLPSDSALPHGRILPQ